MSSSPELAQLGSKLAGDLTMPSPAKIHHQVPIEPACINWQSHQWCSATHHAGDMTTPAMLRSPPDPTSQGKKELRPHVSSSPTKVFTPTGTVSSVPTAFQSVVVTSAAC